MTHSTGRLQERKQVTGLCIRPERLLRYRRRIPDAEINFSSYNFLAWRRRGGARCLSTQNTRPVTEPFSTRSRQRPYCMLAIEAWEFEIDRHTWSSVEAFNKMAAPIELPSDIRLEYLAEVRSMIQQHGNSLWITDIRPRVLPISFTAYSLTLSSHHTRMAQH